MLRSVRNQDGCRIVGYPGLRSAHLFSPKIDLLQRSINLLPWRACEIRPFLDLRDGFSAL
jgi:hypothetical protein